MTSLVYEDLPLMYDDQDRNILIESKNTRTRKNHIPVTTEEACFDLRKTFPSFHYLPEHFSNRFKDALRLENTEDQLQKSDAMKLKELLKEKAHHIRLEDFDPEEFMECKTFPQMCDYISVRFKRNMNKIGASSQDIDILKHSIENNFISHVKWYLEKQMKSFSDNMLQLYLGETKREKRRCKEEERIFFRDTVASLIEYKYNLQRKFIFQMKEKMFGNSNVSADVGLSLRMINKVSNDTKSTGLINKIKNLFTKIF